MSTVDSHCVARSQICLYEFQTGEKGERLLYLILLLFVFTEGNMKKRDTFLGRRSRKRRDRRRTAHSTRKQKHPPHCQTMLGLLKSCQLQSLPTLCNKLNKRKFMKNPVSSNMKRNGGGPLNLLSTSWV